MAELQKRKRSGAKTSRSETVTVRLGPKLRYFAELAARKQRRTLSSFIEWAIQEELGHVYLIEPLINPSGYDKPGFTIKDDMGRLWDVEEQARFIKLAFSYPDLMTHEEQILWKLIQENGVLWYADYLEPMEKWVWRIEEEAVNFDQLRKHWPVFVAVARGEKDRSALPKLEHLNPGSGKEDDEMDDYTPF